jgi:carboxyl-terminal processing protease
MWRKIKWPFFISLMIVVAFAFRSPAEKYFEIAKSLDIFATLFKEVNAYYVDEVEPEKLIRKGIDGMLESLDPYTNYIPEEELEIFRISTTGQYGGIGALIGIVNKKTVITHPYKNYPAYKAGLKVGDELISVNGKSIKGNQTSDVSLLLKGQPKTEVEVKVKRYGQKDDLTFKIKREKISLSNLAYHGLIEPEVAYIKLDDFTPGASKELGEALADLKKVGAKKLILDLRDNPGGLLHEAVNIVSLFIPKGQPVVSTKGKVADWNKTYNTLNAPSDLDMPLIILTGEGSASASEIVAGALQDYDRAVLMGNKTYGKGLVQTTRSLSYNAQLKVTTAKYYIPSGRCIQELDYAHRKEDGTVSKFADSLKLEFKTKCGRKVFDGGGLDPDVEVEEEYLGAVTIALINSGLLFDYASKFCAENPAQPILKEFKMSDSDYSKFVKWVGEQNFVYSTALEKNTEDLVKLAKQEKYYADIETQLKGLQSKIETNKNNDLLNYKKEITEVLEEQIAFHYGLTEGQAEVSLKRDKTLIEARKLLNNPIEYKKILSLE